MNREIKEIQPYLLILIVLYTGGAIWFLFLSLGFLTDIDQIAIRVVNNAFDLTGTVISILLFHSFYQFLKKEDTIPEFLREGDRRPFDSSGVFVYLLVTVAPLFCAMLIPQLESINKRTPGLRDAYQEYGLVLFLWAMSIAGARFYAHRRIEHTNGHIASFTSTILLGLLPTVGANFLMISTWIDFYPQWTPFWNGLIVAGPILFVAMASQALHRVHARENSHNERDDYNLS